MYLVFQSLVVAMRVLIVLAILWAIAVGAGAFVYPVRRYRRKEYGVRQTGR